MGSHTPMPVLRSAVDVVIAVDAEKCINNCVRSWTNPSGATLARDDIMPRRMLSITSTEEAPLRCHMVERVEGQPPMSKKSQSAARTRRQNRRIALLLGVETPMELLWAAPKGPRKSNRFQCETVQCRQASGPE